MMTVYRQDGSEAKLDEATATKWIQLGLATSKPPKKNQPIPQPAKEV